MRSSCCKIGAGYRFFCSKKTCRFLSIFSALVFLQAGLSADLASAQNVQVTPSALSATVVKGQSTTFTLNLRKSGNAQHVWEPKTSVNWVTLSPSYGSSNTITNESDLVKVTVKRRICSWESTLVSCTSGTGGPGSSRLITYPHHHVTQPTPISPPVRRPLRRLPLLLPHRDPPR